MAAGVATVAWSTWYVIDSAVVVVTLSGTLLAAYPLGSYIVIRRGDFRWGVMVQFVGLSIVALLGMWLLGAIIALMFWGEPIGPSN